MYRKSLMLLAVLVGTALTTVAQPLKTRTVDEGGTGMFKAVAVQETSMPDFVVYRPKDLLHAHARCGALPLLLFGNDGWELKAKNFIDFRNTRSLWIENGDRQIYGVLNRPLGREGRLPIAIVSHGFNGTHHFAQDYYGPLAELGWMTYAFDFPCGSVHSRSDSNTMNMSILDEQSDLRAIVNYFRKQPYVDPDRIMLIGESQGGLVSALTAAQMNKDVSALVLIYPALCIPDNWNERYPRLEEIPDTTRLWNVPMGRRFFEEIRTMDPFRTMKKFQKPVLIIQGDADRVVSVEDSRRAAKTYKNARLHIIPGAGHGFKPTERQEAIEQIRQFITSK